MTTIGTRIAIRLFYTKVGEDAAGNGYYVSRKPDEQGKLRRTVLYKGLVEASKVPPLWHAWLHYVSNDVPEQIETYAWQQAPLPNLTGTVLAYLPAGHINRGGKRHKATGDYQAWQPK